MFTDILIYLDLEHSNQIFSQNTPAYNNIPSIQVWLQEDKRFSRYSWNCLFFYYINLCYNLDHEDSKPIFLQDALAHDNAWPYHVWWQNVCWFRRYCLEKQSVIFWTLNLAQQTSSSQALWFMMVYHQTKFGCKQASSLEAIVDSRSYCRQ